MRFLKRDILLVAIIMLLSLVITGCSKKQLDNQLPENTVAEENQDTKTRETSLIKEVLEEKAPVTEEKKNVINEFAIEIGEKIYYSNTMDDHKIYVLDKMTNRISLWVDQRGSWFTYQVGRIFFLSETEGKVYCYDLYSKELLNVYEANDKEPIQSYLVDGEKIYYTTAKGLYQMGLNHEGEQLLREGTIQELLIADGTLHYLEDGNVYKTGHLLCYDGEKDIRQMAFYRGRFYMNTYSSLIVWDQKSEEKEIYEETYVDELSFYEDYLYGFLADGPQPDLVKRHLDNLEIVDVEIRGIFAGNHYLILDSGDILYYDTYLATRYKRLDFTTNALTEITEEEMYQKTEVIKSERAEEDATINPDTQELNNSLAGSKGYDHLRYYRGKLYYEHSAGLYESDGTNTRLLTYNEDNAMYYSMCFIGNKIYYFREKAVAALDLDTYMEEKLMDIPESFRYNRIFYVDDEYVYYCTEGDSIYTHYTIYRVKQSDGEQEKVVNFRSVGSDDLLILEDQILFKDMMDLPVLKLKENNEEMIIDREVWSD